VSVLNHEIVVKWKQQLSQQYITVKFFMASKKILQALAQRWESGVRDLTTVDSNTTHKKVVYM
jgi:hypothetical protein